MELLFSILERFVKIVFWFFPRLDKYVENQVLTIPLAILALTLIVSIGIWLYKRFWKNRKLNPDIYWIITIGSVLAVLALFLVFYTDRKDKAIPFLAAVVSTVKIFTFGYDWRELTEVLGVEDANGKLIYDAVVHRFLVFVGACAPILTARAVMAAFGESFGVLRSKITFCRLHIFSELNEKSICLAEDIYKERGLRPIRIIFANTNKEGLVDEKNDILSRVKLINALTTRKSVLELTSPFRIIKPKYYLISEDETHNVENCLALYEITKSRGAEIYVFSMLESTEMFIDSIERYKYKTEIHTQEDGTEVTETIKERYSTKIILVNEAKMATYNLLLRHPLYEGADRLGTKEIFVVVIGNSRIAQEFVKASLWCGQMKDFTFKMRIIDGGDMEDEFKRTYGDLKKDAKAAGIVLDYDFDKIDVTSSGLAEVLAKYRKEANYYFVATDDDELTMNISEMVRVNVAREKINNEMPVIVPIIGNMDYYQIAKNFISADDDIEYYPSGCYCDIYKEKYITKNSITRLARLFNIIYNIKGIEDKLDGRDVFAIFASFNSKCYLDKRKILLDLLDVLPENKITVSRKSSKRNENEKENNVQSSNKKFEKEEILSVKKKKHYLCLSSIVKKFIETLDDFDEKPEVVKQSNMASVIHVFYKLRDVGLEIVLENDDEKSDSNKNPSTNLQNIEATFRAKSVLERELSKAEMMELLAEETKIDTFAEIEHNRWVVFQLMGGWKSWEINDETIKEMKEQRTRFDARRKLHACIIPNEKLPDLGQELFGDPKRFYNNDCIPLKLIEVGLLECLNSDDNPVETLLGYGNTSLEGRHFPVETSARKEIKDNKDENIIKDDSQATVGANI